MNSLRRRIRSESVLSWTSLGVFALVMTLVVCSVLGFLRGHLVLGACTAAVLVMLLLALRETSTDRAVKRIPELARRMSMCTEEFLAHDKGAVHSAASEAYVDSYMRVVSFAHVLTDRNPKPEDVWNLSTAIDETFAHHVRL